MEFWGNGTLVLVSVMLYYLFVIEVTIASAKGASVRVLWNDKDFLCS